MDILDYTSYNEVRAICGLTTDDMLDETLALELYANALELSLGEVELPSDPPGPGPLSSRFITIKAIPEGVRTVLEQKLYNLTRKFSTIAVALEIPLPLTAGKTLSDSKTTKTRFSPESTYQDVRDMLEGALEVIKDDLENIIASEIASFQYLSVVPQTPDPVTGV